MSVAENLALRTFDQAPLSRKGFLNARAMRTMATSLIESFGFDHRCQKPRLGIYPGEMLQRAVLARELGSGTAKVLIAANPCFGLISRRWILSTLNFWRHVTEGSWCLLVCEDLDELSSLADRVVAMTSGRFVYDSPVSEANVKVIGEKMAE